MKFLIFYILAPRTQPWAHYHYSHAPKLTRATAPLCTRVSLKLVRARVAQKNFSGLEVLRDLRKVFAVLASPIIDYIVINHRVMERASLPRSHPLSPPTPHPAAPTDHDMTDAMHPQRTRARATPAQVPASHGPSQAHRAIRTALTSTPHSTQHTAHQHNPVNTDKRQERQETSPRTSKRLQPQVWLFF